MNGSVNHQSSIHAATAKTRQLISSTEGCGMSKTSPNTIGPKMRASGFMAICKAYGIYSMFGPN
jgi:hypothetical protein